MTSHHSTHPRPRVWRWLYAALAVVLLLATLTVSLLEEHPRPRARSEEPLRPALSLVGNPSFDPAALPPEMRKWYDALWAAIENPQEYPNAADAAASGDSYFIGRTLNFHITALLTAFRVTGDFKLLDEVDRLMEIARAQLKDTNGDGYLNWRYLYDRNSEYYGDDYHEMEEAMAHELVAFVAYALKVNAQYSPRYAEHAAFWTDYLENQFLAKWHARNPDSEFSPLDKSLTHPYAGLMRMYYYLYRLTGKRPYLYEAERRADELDKVMVEQKTALGEAFTWDHRGFGGSPWGCQPTGYAMHTVGVFIDLSLERYNHYASRSYMEHYAATFRDLVLIYGTQQMAGNICGEGTERFSLYPISPLPALALWDKSGKLTALNIEAYTEFEGEGRPTRVFIPAYMLLITAQDTAQLGLSGEAIPTEIPKPTITLPPDGHTWQEAPE